jgi:hypothetical protein
MVYKVEYDQNNSKWWGGNICNEAVVGYLKNSIPYSPGEKNIENLVQHSLQKFKPDTVLLLVRNFTVTHKIRGGFQS